MLIDNNPIRIFLVKLCVVIIQVELNGDIRKLRLKSRNF